MPHHTDFADELIAERRADTDALPDDMPGWMAATITRIDIFSMWVGRIVCFLVFPILGAMVYEVVMRRFFIAPTVWAYDISRMFYGAMFMLGAGYTLMRGVHVRADFLYRTFSERVQGRIDLALYLLLYFPGLIAFMWSSWFFAYESVAGLERGMDTAWMPYLGPVKSALPAGIALLLIQGVSEVLKCWYAATRGRWP